MNPICEGGINPFQTKDLGYAALKQAHGNLVQRITFGELLEVRAKLHKSFSGDTLVLRDMFSVTDELLARTDIMPVFRPEYGSLRSIVDWMRRSGIRVKTNWEKVGTQRTKHHDEVPAPKLLFVNRSAAPDKDTLWENAKTPPEVARVLLPPRTQWIDFYGYADMEILYFHVTGAHLDAEGTSTLFPADHIEGGIYACGKCFGDIMFFDWCTATCLDPKMGARLAHVIPLRKK